MSMNQNQVITLQEQARNAVPTWPRRKPGPVGRWSPLWPVYAELRRKRFTIREAVDWLICEGAVPAGDRKKAEYGLAMVDSRRRRTEGPAPSPGGKTAAKAAAGAKRGRPREKQRAESAELAVCAL